MSSEAVPGGSGIATASLLSQLCDITGLDKKEAHGLLVKTNYDLTIAVNMFLSDVQEKDGVIVLGSDTDDDDKKRPGKDINSNDKKKIKMNNIDNSDSLKADSEVNADKSLMTNEINGGLNDPSDENVLKYNEEEMLQKALEASEVEFQLKEPNALETFQILSKNYPQYDSSALQKLCNDYEGRSGELEEFVQHHIYTLPTKLEAEKSKLKSHLEELAAAGVEEAKDMIIEDCPACKKPKIVEDPAAKIFICQNASCQEESCRKCKQTQHIPYECEDKPFDVNLNQLDNKVKLWNENLDFEIINMKPKRSFDESDELDKEFRLAEGQFLRFSASTTKKYKIQSIEIARNKKLQEKFDVKKEELKKIGKEECLLLFHGTPQKNIRPILEKNFDINIIANGRAYGNGVYFSECPEVSLGYSKDQKSLILCKVLTGNNSKEVKDPVKRKNAKGERCWAIVVPEVDQILPRYVINFI